MADRYLRSTTGADANSGASWSLAKATTLNLAGIDTAGDRLFFSYVHNEAVSAATTAAWAGTSASPSSIISCEDATEPPTQRRKGATLTISTTTFAWQGTAYTFGITFNITATSSSTFSFGSGASASQCYEECDFILATGAGATSSIAFGTTTGSAGTRMELINCGFKLSSSSHVLGIARFTHLKGGGVLAGSATPSGTSKGFFAIGIGSRPTKLLVDGFDMSALATNANLVHLTEGAGASVILRDIKLPTGWAGNLVAPGTTMIQGTRVEAWNMDDSATNYRVWIEDFSGSVKHSASIYRDGFSGGTKHSLRMATNANCNWPVDELTGVELPLDVDVGTHTVFVDVLTDGVTLNNTDVRLDVLYMGDAGSPLGSWGGPITVDTLAASVNHPVSTEDWTSVGIASPIKQRLSVTVTAAQAGYLMGRVVVSRPNTVVFVDPEMRKA